MSNIKIIVCAHKVTDIPSHKFFLPIQAGAAIHSHIKTFIPDDSGDNISAKNPNYCELTAHYWAWKNLKDVDIIGLNHYRRYFDFERKSTIPYRHFTSVDDFLSHDYIFPDLEQVFSHYDIILPSTRNFPISIASEYALMHIVDDWRILKEVIGELSPEYIPAFEKTMEKSNQLSSYNMFIMRWQLFDEYSSWLFRILFEVEKRCKISAYPVQARIFGYMSERLINVFAEYKQLRIKHVPIIIPLDDFKPSMNASKWEYLKWRAKNDLAFRISGL